MHSRLHENEQTDSTINYKWEVPYYELCYYFENINIGQYSFKLHLDSTGQLLKSGTAFELPNFNEHPQRLHFLTKKEIYAFAKKQIDTTDCITSIDFFKGHIIWEFKKRGTHNKTKGLWIVLISAHTGETLSKIFSMSTGL